MAERTTPVAHYAPITGKREWLAPRSNGARLHAGVDLGAPRGTPVLSPEPGRVVLVELHADSTQAWKGYGPAIVVIEGASGAYHRLAHLSSTGVRVRRGDIIAQAGVPIAEVGPLERVVNGEVRRNDHCHWEVLVQPRRTAPFATVELSVDPLAWLVGQVVQYDAVLNGGPPHPSNLPLTPRAFRLAYRGSLSPAPRLRGALPAANPTRSPSAADSSAATAQASTSTQSATTDSTRRNPPTRGPATSGKSGGLWLAILAVLAVSLMSGSRN